MRTLPGKKINLFIIGYLMLQVVLIVRCYFASEKFFGWQMYSNPLMYRTRFFGTGPDGVRIPLDKNLYHRWMNVKANGEILTPSEKYRMSSRGPKFLFAESGRIPGFLCAKLHPEGFQKIEVEMEFREGGNSAFKRTSFQKDCFALPR